MLSAQTCKAARALLDWSQSDLAERAGVGLSTVLDFEKARRALRAANRAAIERAFKAAGIVFQNGESPGVRLQPKRSRKGAA